jgi:hypothetical protein
MQPKTFTQVHPFYPAAVRAQDLGVVRLLPLLPALLFIIRLIAGLNINITGLK